MDLLIDPKYNFHVGLHSELRNSPLPDVHQKDGRLVCFFEPAIRAPFDSRLARLTLTLGVMRGDGDISYSPHMLLLGRRPWVVDIEHVLWFFTDQYGVGTYEDLGLQRWKSVIARRVLEQRSCRRILALSNAALTSMVDHFGDSDAIMGKLQIFEPQVRVPRAVDFSQRTGSRILLVISRHSDAYRKGLDIAVAVQRTRLQLGIDGELLIVGPVEQNSDWVHIPGIRLVGERTHDQMLNEIYPSCDILLFPSRSDTHGTTILEARSRGVVPVAFHGPQVIATDELMEHGRTGLVVEYDGPAEPNILAPSVPDSDFVGQVIFLLKRQDLLASMQRSTHAEMIGSAFDADRGLARFSEILHSAIEDKDGT